MSGQKPYCLMPWIHFHMTSNGNVNACCVSSIKYGNINNQSTTEIWSSESVKQIREKFSNGLPDNRCKVCINREKSGAKSIRQETYEKFKEVKIEEVKSPIYFDIRFSNVCNFRCRTCWHGASSKWFNEAKQLKTNFGEKAIIQNVTDFENFIKQNGEALKQAKEIYFAGGEPLVTEEHYLLLDFLLKQQITNVKLRYNTNFSVLEFKNYNIIDYWSKFTNVEVLASVDESNELGEYIRKELDWDKFLENRDKIRCLPNVVFKISPTISVFNVKSLTEFYTKCVKLDLIEPNDFYINILDRPFHYNVKVLSDKIKKEITAEYRLFIAGANLPLEIKKQFQSIIDFMNADDLHHKYWSKFISETKTIDNLRAEHFKSVLNWVK